MHLFIMKRIFIPATLLVVPFAVAIAADDTPSAPAKPKRDPAELFKAIDRDGDGFLSFEEYKASTIGQIDPSRVESVFKKKDANGDGKLTLSEFMFVPPREPAKPAGADVKKEKKKTDAPKQ